MNSANFEGLATLFRCFPLGNFIAKRYQELVDYVKEKGTMEYDLRKLL